MNYIGILISGTRGSGKTTITRKLCEQSPLFKQCKAITTRERRDGDNDEYDYISNQEFIRHRDARELITDISYGGNNYGFLSSAVRSILDTTNVPILVVAPECVKPINDNEQKSNRQYFSVFIDAGDSIIDDRLTSRPGYNKTQEEHQRIEDRKHEKEAHYSIKNNHELKDVVDLILHLWDYRNSGGLLSKKSIELSIKGGLLLTNANIANIKGASYDLCLGDAYYQNGKHEKLIEDRMFLNIDPGDYVLVTCKENAALPLTIAARYDITVSLFMEGLILSNGPQVDPGYSGGLLCLLYNTSNQYVKIKRGQHFATIEFIKLIEPTIPYDDHHQNQTSLAHYLVDERKGSAYKDLNDGFKKIQDEFSKLKTERIIEKWLPIVVAILMLGLTVYNVFIKKP